MISHEASTGSLKAVRYETDTQAGIPPRRAVSPALAAIQIDDDSGSGNTARPHPHPHPPTPPPTIRPRSSPNGATTSEKRDSGIAPSVSTTDGAPSQVLSAARPNLPTITVQDEESADHTTSRSRSPVAANKTARERAQARGLSHSSSPPPRVLRMMSLKGAPAAPGSSSSAITTADDMNLNDLASDKVTFSTRGSLLFGGKRMQEIIAAKGEEVESTRADGASGRMPSKDVRSEENAAGPSTVDNNVDTQEHSQDTELPSSETQHDDKPKHGLVAGRRQPSEQMLQAINGGRVLSTEEVTFSLRVRSMYDHGDERAADWVGSLDGTLSGKTSPDNGGRDTNTPDMMQHELNVQKIRRPASKQSFVNADPRASVYSRAPSEVAGGFEDYEDVDSRYVDRYGFIHAERPASRLSESSNQLKGMGMQRVATSLRVEAEQPRRDRRSKRGSPSIRSSRSLPSGLNGAASKRGSLSIRSMHVSTPRTSPFWSRGRKTLAEASDMLTVPPGLEDIDENADAGTTASALKQREWAREEKWQKMATPVEYRTAGRGGGMRFHFDTTDSKLINRTWKGIPDRWRATAWHSFLTASAKKRNSPATDEELIGQFHKLQGESSADDIQIDVDVPRTINLHVMFRKRYRGGQRLLFRVLHAVSLYFPDTGYVQGMAALAVTLLCYYEEEMAFVMLVRLWQLRGLEQLFDPGFESLLACLKEFESDWLRAGPVAAHLGDLAIDSTAWGTKWYLTLFNMSVPFPAQLRIWDVFMLLGDAAAPAGAYGGADFDVLHAASAALIDATREILLGSEFENAMKVLTSFVPIRDEDLLMRVVRTEWRLKKKRDGAAGKM